MPPTGGLCTFVIFEHVRVAKKSDDFIASSSHEAFDNFMKMAVGNRTEQFLLSLTSDLEYDESLEVGDRAVAIMRRYSDLNVRGYGFAHHRVASTGIDSGKLWKHHSMLSEEAASVLNSSKLERDLTVPLLLSDSLAVVEYEVDKDPHAQQPRLLNLKCSKRALLPFHTVCHSNSTYLKGGRTNSAYCHYDDDPNKGRWRTYKTASDMVNQIQSVAHSADSLVAENFGWAFYDVDLEDYLGDCTLYWRVNHGKSQDSEAAAYYRLKKAVQQLNSQKNRMSDYAKTHEAGAASEGAPTTGTHTQEQQHHHKKFEITA
ncbi:hypothetical protein HPB50_027448 [Hyalomma asiaticum]|uniref:Uncharacterized protein n=1 Tax=Hyalomma asiaticum TaxID=266040 RepID=A0ACB7S3W3_HYAAI|nr:hypothetical protein HPB50_027448 [Hyalomma asiaticum]